MFATRLLATLMTLVLVVSACSSSGEQAAGETAEPSPSTTTATGGAVQETNPAPPQIAQADAYVEVLAQTVNLGGTLEIPRGASWGNDIGPEDLDTISERGFSAVRLPIRFSEWAAVEAPYALEPELVAEVNAYLDRAELLGMGIIVDLHHFDQMNTDPQGNRDRLVGIWRQIIAEFGDRDPSLVAFELLNEPHGELTPELWNDVLADVVAAIREEGSNHTLIFGPGSWNNLGVLDRLVLPDDDNIIVTFHYYDPFDFTHQGADWTANDMVDVRTSWAPDENGAGDAVDADFAEAAQWAAERNVPLFVGEFGVHTVADADDRLAWTEFVRQTAEKYGIAWGIWDLTGDKFGMFDEATQAWDPGAVAALGLG